MSFAGEESPFEALSELLQGESPGTRGLRILLFALFLGLALFEGMGLWRLLARSDIVPESSGEIVLVEDRARLEGMVKDFSATMLFWIGAAVAAIILPLVVWNAKPAE